MGPLSLYCEPFCPLPPALIMPLCVTSVVHCHWIVCVASPTTTGVNVIGEMPSTGQIRPGLVMDIGRSLSLSEMPSGWGGIGQHRGCVAGNANRYGWSIKRQVAVVSRVVNTLPINLLHVDGSGNRRNEQADGIQTINRTHKIRNGWCDHT